MINPESTQSKSVTIGLQLSIPGFPVYVGQTILDYVGDEPSPADLTVALELGDEDTWWIPLYHPLILFTEIKDNKPPRTGFSYAIPFQDVDFTLIFNRAQIVSCFLLPPALVTPYLEMFDNLALTEISPPDRQSTPNQERGQKAKFTVVGKPPKGT